MTLLLLVCGIYIATRRQSGLVDTELIPAAIRPDASGSPGESEASLVVPSPTSPIANDTRSALVETNEVAVDLAEELRKCRESLAAAEAGEAALRSEVARIKSELLFLKHPEETPYGLFLRSPEGREISDPKILSEIKDWLELFPVFLVPGEATWLADRIRLHDWKQFAPTAERAVIQYFGPSRIAKVISPEALAKLREEYAGIISFPD
ncbi:MAG TPA: hypothetical protein VK550_16215 [Polyangiaceae bacterium]|nr:hypothetical protein [Polyangiaceae bacterium]